MRNTVAAFSILALAACGGDDGGPSGGPVTLDELPDAYTGVLCDRIAECSILGGYIFTQLACADLAYEFRNGSLVELEQGIEDGTIVYDADAMGACLDALATASCEDLALNSFDGLPGCEGAIAGQIAEGDACSLNLECASGLYCDTGLACPGTCEARLAEGAACADLDGECATGLSCTNQVCTAPPGLGDECTDLSCGLGTQCSEASMTCVAITHDAGEGDACDPVEGVMCAGALACVGEAVDAFVCRPRVAVGAACFPGIPNPCVADALCSSTEAGTEGVCEALPGAGQPCREGGSLFDRDCKGSAVCDDDTGMCVARIDNGDACTIDVECVNGCDVTCQDPVACE